MNKRKILLLEPFSEKHFSQIEKSAGEDFCIKKLTADEENFDEKLKIEIKDAEIIVGQPPVELLQHIENTAPKLKLIQMTWAGTDIYTRSIIPFPKESVSLANASGAYGMVISQYVIGLILSLMLNFKAYGEQQNKKIWKRIGPIKSLDSANVLIYGAGDIGTEVAKRLQGFSAHAIGVCRNVKKERPFFDEVCTLSDSEKYLKDADVVIGCIPNDKETQGFMNSTRLGMMKKGSIIVNVGRGNFIDCMALDDFLKKGHLWGAALDVTNPEPLPDNHPLWENPKCIITPHTSGVAFSHLDETENLICDIVCENVTRYIKNENLINKVF